MFFDGYKRKLKTMAAVLVSFIPFLLIYFFVEWERGRR